MDGDYANEGEESMRRIGITGISGSLGTALTNHYVNAGIGPIVGITRDELKAEQISEKYGGMNGPVRVMVVPEGISDVDKMKEVFRGCDVLIHCAALKRISGSVYASEEMMQTNCVGTMNVIRAAADVGVQRVVVISSDKACEPSNLYGATKQVAECMAVQYNSFSYPKGTAISVVRYGNVINSRGSVIPLWKELHRRGESLCLTHKDMVRFMITMDQAVNLITAAIFSMKGGEIILPILPSARMYDVALAVCGDESKIKILDQLRPGGEKIAEIMLNQEEPSRTVRRTIQGGFNGGIDVYTVLPSHRTWSNEPYVGAPVLPNFEYRSDTNASWLTVDDLKGMI